MFNRSRGFAFPALLAGLALVAAAFGADPALAQVDVTAATTALTDAETGVTTIAGGMLGVVAAGIAIKWVLGFLIN